MTTPLIGILLVTQTVEGPALVFRWPPYPESSPRLMRPLTYRQGTRHGFDGIWQASHLPESLEEEQEIEDAIAHSYSEPDEDDDSYLWQRPGPKPASDERSRSRSRAASTRSSPIRDEYGANYDETVGNMKHEYEHVFDFSSAFLAEVLSPNRELCYQKFELIIDDLAFVGHPVCQSKDNVWRFDNVTEPPAPTRNDTVSPERGRSMPRGNGSISDETIYENSDAIAPNVRTRDSHPAGDDFDSISFFHLILVIDRPDPASYHTTDLSKLLHPFYSQVAFKLTAGLLHEESRTSFVSKQCARLMALADACAAAGMSYHDFAYEAAARIPLAGVMRQVYEAIKVDGTVRVSVNHISIDIQLPPSTPDEWFAAEEENSRSQDWDEQAEDMINDGTGFGWVTRLRPWNALLMLDEPQHIAERLEPVSIANGAGGPRSHATQNGSSTPDEVLEEERTLQELRNRFYQTISPTLSLSEVANLLDIDLWMDVLPLARSLIYTRKAKIIDVVRENLKNIYFPTASSDGPLWPYIEEFARLFPTLPPLPTLLSHLSVTPVPFISIVPQSTKDRQPYLDALIWMLRRGLLEMMQVRVRIVATEELKRIVWAARLAKARERFQADSVDDKSSTEDDTTSPSVPSALRSPFLGVRARLHSTDISRSPLIQPQNSSSEEDEEKTSDDLPEKWSDEDSIITPSVIPDPGRATKLERRWLDAMIKGKDIRIVELFERMLPYFNGRTTTDEILYRTDVKRRELREVFHRFDPYIMTVLHP